MDIEKFINLFNLIDDLIILSNNKEELNIINKILSKINIYYWISLDFTKQFSINNMSFKNEINTNNYNLEFEEIMYLLIINEIKFVNILKNIYVSILKTNNENKEVNELHLNDKCYFNANIYKLNSRIYYKFIREFLGFN